MHISTSDTQTHTETYVNTHMCAHTYVHKHTQLYTQCKWLKHSPRSFHLPAGSDALATRLLVSLAQGRISLYPLPSPRHPRPPAPALKSKRKKEKKQKKNKNNSGNQIICVGIKQQQRRRRRARWQRSRQHIKLRLAQDIRNRGGRERASETMPERKICTVCVGAQGEQGK